MKISSYLRRRFKHGFTLIELLLVIGIIAILASIVIVAINPTKQLGDARDAQRRSDVNTILNAVYQYAIDNNGSLPSGIPTTGTGAHVCKTAICRTAPTDSIDDASGDSLSGISLDILTGSYLVSVPADPQAPSTQSGSYYTILQDSNGRITVTAQTYEGSSAITVTR